MEKSLQEVFIDMVNTANPDLGLSLTDVTFGIPDKYITGNEGDVWNSKLVLTAKSESPAFKGSKEYHFRRFDFTHPNGEDVYTLATTDVLENWADNAYVLFNLNQMLPNRKLTENEITVTWGAIGSDVSGNWTDIKVRIDPNHLKWTGAFVYRVYDGKDNLQLKAGELDGFK